MVPELIKNVPTLGQSEISLPSSLWFSNGLYPKTAERNPQHENCLWRIHFSFFFWFFWHISYKNQHYTVYLFLEKCSTFFGWYFHPSSRVHTQLYLQFLVLVKPLLLPAAIVEELELVWVWCGKCIDLFWCSCNVCAPDDGWRCHPKHVEQCSRNK